MIFPLLSALLTLTSPMYSPRRVTIKESPSPTPLTVDIWHNINPCFNSIPATRPITDFFEIAGTGRTGGMLLGDTGFGVKTGDA
ncbi:uncharacterized protein METZ01_LOCUS480889, partial [marine metagenome]